MSRLAPLGAWIWDMEGDNPYFGLLALADVIVATLDSISMVSEAAATHAPRYCWRNCRGDRKESAFSSGDFSARIVFVVFSRPSQDLAGFAQSTTPQWQVRMWPADLGWASQLDNTTRRCPMSETEFQETHVCQSRPSFRRPHGSRLRQISVPMPWLHDTRARLAL